MPLTTLSRRHYQPSPIQTCPNSPFALWSLALEPLRTIGTTRSKQDGVSQEDPQHGNGEPSELYEAYMRSLANTTRTRRAEGPRITTDTGAYTLTYEVRQG